MAWILWSTVSIVKSILNHNPKGMTFRLVVTIHSTYILLLLLLKYIQELRLFVFCNLKHSIYSDRAPHSEIGIDTIISY